MTVSHGEDDCVSRGEDAMSLSNMVLQLVKQNGEWSLQLLYCHFGEQKKKRIFLRTSVISVPKRSTHVDSLYILGGNSHDSLNPNQSD